MAGAAGDDDALAGAEEDGATIDFGATDGEATFEYKEKLVFARVAMPRELAVYLGYLEILIIYLGEDAWRPEFRERGGGLFEGDRNYEGLERHR